ncbi:hypothetical protein L3X38_013375 [Prunus dulcis]|uniref:Uncharacterized protein n=1 Tax=Prunus dulcis TaxID=3755 RepID=A0AAD4WL40_PRUDU|nr:hypothetical protein L3X38_013375 [Prunus dulcis]
MVLMAPNGEAQMPTLLLHAPFLPFINPCSSPNESNHMPTKPRDGQPKKEKIPSSLHHALSPTKDIIIPCNIIGHQLQQLRLPILIFL